MYFYVSTKKKEQVLRFKEWKERKKNQKKNQNIFDGNATCLDVRIIEHSDFLSESSLEGNAFGSNGIGWP